MRVGRDPFYGGLFFLPSFFTDFLTDRTLDCIGASSIHQLLVFFLLPLLYTGWLRARALNIPHNPSLSLAFSVHLNMRIALNSMISSCVSLVLC